MTPREEVERGEPRTGELRTDIIVRRVVAEMKEIFSRQYPPARYPNATWEADEWSLLPSDASTIERRAKWTLFFRARDEDCGEPMPPEYANVIKAFIVDKNFGRDNAVQHARAAQHLWAAIASRLRGEPFSWIGLRKEDFEAAEMRARHYVTGAKLKHIVSWLEVQEIVEPLGYVPGPRKPTVAQDATIEGRIARLDRLPTRRAIVAIAEVFHRRNESRADGTPLFSPADRLLVCAVGLMLLTGLRVTELLTLPVDCLRREVYRGRARWAIYYWNLKTQSRLRLLVPRWLSPLAAELAQQLIAELHTLTARARERARINERSLLEGRFVLRGDDFDYTDRDRLTLRQAAKVLAYSTPWSLSTAMTEGTVALTTQSTSRRLSRILFAREDVVAWVRANRPDRLALIPLDAELQPVDIAEALGVGPTAVSSLAQRQKWRRRSRTHNDREMDVRWTVPTTDVEAELLKRQGTMRTWYLGRRKWQLISETLLILPGNSFNSKRPEHPLLVEHVAYHQIFCWLSGQSGTPSIFTRLGITEPTDLTRPDGTPSPRAGQSVRMRPHAARHWINTVANKAGMTAFQITIWMQRADPRQTRLYLHEHTAADVADLVKNGIVDGRFAGDLVERYRKLPEKIRGRILNVISAGHVLEGGRICVQDFCEDGCPVHKICGLCPHHLRDTSDPDLRAVTERHRDSHERAVAVIDAAERSGLRVVGRQKSLNLQAAAAYAKALADDSSTSATTSEID